MFDRSNEVAFSVSVVRVLVVDDFAGFRGSVCSMVAKHPGLEVAGEAADGVEAVHKAEELQPDLIVLDIGLPSINGLEVARRIGRVSPKSRVIFASLESSADVVQEALRLGARGYVVKADIAAQLLAAIDAVLQGEHFVVGRLIRTGIGLSNPLNQPGAFDRL
jgi:DNA-binding NarL/FixJ family response regulator